MKYTIYKTTNTINNKYYIGKHQTTDPNDSYLGSGKGIRAAIKKYGKENFIKEVLFVFDNERDMNLKEQELLSEEFVERSNNYNSAVGGEGGPHFKGRRHSKHTIDRIKKSCKNRKGTPRSKDNIESHKRTRYKNNNGVYCSTDTKKKLSKAASNKIWITDGKTTLKVDKDTPLQTGWKRGRKIK